jgi:hypothetical protein
MNQSKQFKDVNLKEFINDLVSSSKDEIRDVLGFNLDKTITDDLGILALSLCVKVPTKDQNGDSFSLHSLCCTQSLGREGYDFDPSTIRKWRLNRMFRLLSDLRAVRTMRLSDQDFKNKYTKNGSNLKILDVDIFNIYHMATVLLYHKISGNDKITKVKQSQIIDKFIEASFMGEEMDYYSLWLATGLSANSIYESSSFPCAFRGSNFIRKTTKDGRQYVNFINSFTLIDEKNKRTNLYPALALGLIQWTGTRALDLILSYQKFYLSKDYLAAQVRLFKRESQSPYYSRWFKTVMQASFRDISTNLQLAKLFHKYFIVSADGPLAVQKRAETQLKHFNERIKQINYTV